MAINLKNERVLQLARRASEATGLSQTSAIELALERLLAEQGIDPRDAKVDGVLQHVRAISRAYRRAPGQVNDEVASIDNLYDDAGLPR